MKFAEKHIEKMVLFAHLGVLLFAIGSIFNIGEYLSGKGHNDIMAYALGSALGIVLVSSAIMLTLTDYDTEPVTFKRLAIGVVAIGFLSGTIQTWSYMAHGDSFWSAALIGYGLPIICEGYLAYCVALHTAAERRKKIRNATDGTQERIAEAISDALSDVDVSKVKKHVEKKIDAIVRSQVDAVAASMMPPTITVVESDTTAKLLEDKEPTTANPVISSQITAKPKSTLPDANEARYRQIEERRQSIIAAIAANGSLGITEIAEKLRDDFGITNGLGDRTLRAD